jgi:hypothetical protein
VTVRGTQPAEVKYRPGVDEMMQVQKISDHERLAAYWPAARAALHRLLAMLNREPHSAAYGNFDRSFWAWRFRDCPVTMFHAAIVPLAQAWDSPLPENSLYRNPRILEWLGGALDRACSAQNANGSFDIWGPHTDHPGVALAMALVACRSLEILGDGLEPGRVPQIRRMAERACDFALEHDEDYAFISNHQAHFALAFHHAAKLLGRVAYQQRADRIIDSILAAQSPDGWYAEYGGPDPGYESLGISYLASYWQSTRSPALLDSLRRSVEFYSYCVHPDGSVGGVYGSRHTQQYFPAGFEILSGAIPMAAAVARYMSQRLERGNVVTLPVVDAENLSALAGNYLDACAARPDAPSGAVPPLPCEKMEDIRHFPASGITAAGAPLYYAVMNAAKGGVCRVFDRRSGTLAYEDAGYVVRAGGAQWTSQRMQPLPPKSVSASNEVSCSNPFTEIQPEAGTPARFLLFRLASLTLFRSVRLGAWLRRQIIARLITASRKGPLRLERRVRFGADEIAFSDRIEMERPVPVAAAELVRSFTAIHMGSARYFHPAELDESPLPGTSGLARELETRGSATCIFRLRFSAAAKPELLSGAAANRAEAAQPEGTLTRR